MTVAEMAKYLGQTADYYGIPDLVIEVKIVDARMSWGQLQLQIQAVSGSGSKWINADSLGGLS